MNFKLITAGHEYVLHETTRNNDLIKAIHTGSFPGLTTVDTIRGPVSMNLSENIPFILEGDHFKQDTPKPPSINVF